MKPPRQWWEMNDAQADLFRQIQRTHKLTTCEFVEAAKAAPEYADRWNDWWGVLPTHEYVDLKSHAVHGEFNAR